MIVSNPNTIYNVNMFKYLVEINEILMILISNYNIISNAIDVDSIEGRKLE